jgi:hypothetical protein
MEVDQDHFLPCGSATASAGELSCTYYLRSNQRDFPRNTVAIRGVAVRVSILRPGVYFSPEAFPLHYICIPSSIETISESCFRGCTHLVSLTFESGCQISHLGASSFTSCSSLLSICIPSSIKAISDSCFHQCLRLAKVTLESGLHLSVLGESAFAACSSIQSICIPSSIETISKFCFCGCFDLSDFRFAPDSKILTIGDSAFGLCRSLQSICIPERLNDVPGAAMTTSGVCDITVDPDNPWLRVRDGFLCDFGERLLVYYFGKGRDLVVWRDIETIASDCFARRVSVSSVSFEPGSRISSFGKSAFASCSLRSVSIPSTIETISTNCFGGCENLVDVRFESGCTISVLGELAFCSCKSLRSICIPSSVETIAKSCFGFCENLSDFTFESGSRISTIGDAAFVNCASLQAISIPSGLRQVTGLAFADSRLWNVAVDPNNRFLRVAGDFLIASVPITLVRYFGNRSCLMISKRIQGISAGCFAGRDSIVSITFESSHTVSFLGESAFEDCLFLQSVCIPSSIETIGESCFMHCEQLSDLTFESGSRLVNLGESRDGISRSLMISGV